MRRRLFEDLVVSRTDGPGSRGAAVPASVVIHAALLSAVVIVPTLTPGELPPPQTAPIVLTMPGVPAPPAPPGNPPPIRRAAHTVAAPANRLVAPPETPDALPEPDGEDTTGGYGTVGISCGGCPGDGPTDNQDGEAGSPGPATPVVRPGFLGVRPPSKVKDVLPVYPDLARRAGVEGIVIIECTIDPQGNVAGAQILKGHPLLDAAAIDAVRQWRYTPTLLNGVPVSVVMTVTAQFRLRR